MEDIRAEEGAGIPGPRQTGGVENGITYEVDFAQGHKTGFSVTGRTTASSSPPW